MQKLGGEASSIKQAEIDENLSNLVSQPWTETLPVPRSASRSKRRTLDRQLVVHKRTSLLPLACCEVGSFPCAANLNRERSSVPLFK